MTHRQISILLNTIGVLILMAWVFKVFTVERNVMLFSAIACFILASAIPKFLGAGKRRGGPGAP